MGRVLRVFTFPSRMPRAGARMLLLFFIVPGVAAWPPYRVNRSTNSPRWFLRMAAKGHIQVDIRSQVSGLHASKAGAKCNGKLFSNIYLHRHDSSGTIDLVE